MISTNNSDHEWHEIAPHVDEAIEELPEELRVVLTEHFLRRRTQAEIAKGLGVSASTVSRRIDAGLQQLRGKLKRAGVIASVAVLASLLAENAASAAPASLAVALGKMAMSGVNSGAAAVSTGTGVAAGAMTAAAKIKIAAVVVAVLAVGGVVAHEMAGQPEELVTKQTETVGLPDREESDNVQEGAPAAGDVADEGATAVGPQVDPNQPPAALRRVLYDIDGDPRANILDLATGEVLKLPDFGGDSGEYRRWFEDQGGGDLAYDNPKGGGLFALPGAKLALLDAQAWEAVDALANDDLRKRIAEKGERVVRLKEYAAGPKPWPVFVGVRTRDDRVAVVRVLGFVEGSARRLPGLELEVKLRGPFVTAQEMAAKQAQAQADRRRTLYDIETDPRMNVLDAATGDVFKMPNFQDGQAGWQWIKEQGKGDVVFDCTTPGGLLYAVCHAKMVLLDANDWAGADRMSNSELRKRLAQGGGESIDLSRYKNRPDLLPGFVGVRTRDDRMSIISVVRYVKDPVHHWPGLEIEVKPRNASYTVVRQLAGKNQIEPRDWDEDHDPPGAPRIELFDEMGPVIERVVNDDGAGKDFLIDFDTGKLFTPPKGFGNEPLKYFRENGIDAGGETAVGLQGLGCVDMVVVSFRELLPKIEKNGAVNPQELIDELGRRKRQEMIEMSARDGVPAEFLFITREGGVGRLTIVEINKHPNKRPRYVRIRYRMIGKLAVPGDVRIETIKPMRVACVRHVGPFEEYRGAWAKLMAWAGPLGLVGPKTVYAGISYDDPSVVEPAKLRADACISVPKDMVFEQGGGGPIPERRRWRACSQHPSRAVRNNSREHL